MIHVEDLTVRYPGRKEPALSRVNLTLRDDETVLLLGPSGCGKSTLALALSGLIPNSLDVQFSGRVLIDGVDTREADIATLSRRVGVVFQDPDAQFVMLDVESEMAFALENLRMPPAEIDRRIDDALSAANMTDRRYDKVWQLSGGQKQRVALAALLAMHPQVIVFDEPTANLDPAGARDVFAQIAALKRAGQHTLVIIEHRLDAIMHLVDRVVVMGEQGRIVADGAPQHVFDDCFGELRRLGVWMPQVSALAHRLGARPAPITLDEAHESWRARVSQFAFEQTTRAPTPGKTPGRAPGKTPGKAPGKAPGKICSTQESPAVHVHQLTYRYPSRVALERVDLSVPRHDFLAIVGANGAGKTTLAGCMAGVLTPPVGTVFINGADVATLSPQALARQVGFVFQNPEHQFVTDTVADELRFSLRRSDLPRAEIERRVEAMLARFRLDRYAGVNPFTLSHGEKRRLSVATMLMRDQEILILDEPTFGQDQHTAGELMAMLRALHAEGRTIVIITHDMALAAEHACHVAVMGEGRMLDCGPTRDVFARADTLAQARLDLPPLARLAQRLGFNALTVEDFYAVTQGAALNMAQGVS